MPRPQHPTYAGIELSAVELGQALRTYATLSINGATTAMRLDVLNSAHRVLMQCDDELLALLSSLRFQRDREDERNDRENRRLGLTPDT